MAAIESLNQQLDSLLNQLQREGLLDDQFTQLLQLQDDSNPNFIDEVTSLYFEDSAGKLDKLRAKLSVDAPDYGELDQIVHQLKGSSASFGASAVAQHCVQVLLPTLFPSLLPLARSL